MDVAPDALDRAYEKWHEASVAYEAGQVELAASRYAEALDAGLAVLEEAHLLDLCDTLISCYTKLHQFGNAVACGRKTLAFLESNVSDTGPEHRSTIIRLRHSLALGLSAMHNTDQGLSDKLREARDLHQSNLVALRHDHQNAKPIDTNVVQALLLETREALALDLFKLGTATKDESAAASSYKRALRLFKDVVAARKKSAVTTEPDAPLVRVKFHLATVQFHLEKYAEAQQLFSEVRSRLGSLKTFSSPGERHDFERIRESTIIYMADGAKALQALEDKAADSKLLDSHSSVSNIVQPRAQSHENMPSNGSLSEPRNRSADGTHIIKSNPTRPPQPSQDSPSNIREELHRSRSASQATPQVGTPRPHGSKSNDSVAHIPTTPSIERPFVQPKRFSPSTFHHRPVAVSLQSVENASEADWQRPSSGESQGRKLPRPNSPRTPNSATAVAPSIHIAEWQQGLSSLSLMLDPAVPAIETENRSQLQSQLGRPSSSSLAEVDIADQASSSRRPRTSPKNISPKTQQSQRDRPPTESTSVPAQQAQDPPPPQGSTIQEVVSTSPNANTGHPLLAKAQSAISNLGVSTSLPLSEGAFHVPGAFPSPAPTWAVNSRRGARTTDDLPARALAPQVSTPPLAPPSDGRHRSRSVDGRAENPSGSSIPAPSMLSSNPVNAPATNSSNMIGGHARAQFGHWNATTSTSFFFLFSLILDADDLRFTVTQNNYGLQPEQVQALFANAMKAALEAVMSQPLPKLPQPPP